MKKYFFPASLTVILVSASVAIALTISVYDNLPDNTYLPASGTLTGLPASGTLTGLPASGTLTGWFDIKAAMPIEQYTIDSAKFTFNFTDDIDLIPRFSDYETYTERSDDVTSVKRYEYDYYFDDYELIQLKIGDQTTFNWTKYYEETIYDADQSSTDSYPYNGQELNHTVINYDVIEGYGGHLEVTQYLDANAFENLNEDGIIYFMLDMGYGDIFFNQGRLDLEYNLTPTPEPATLLLVLFALGAAGLTRSVKKYFKF